MSFPRAKIHRFNEDTSCAPPPGSYDPKLDTKVKGAVLPTSKRFPDQQCSSSSLDNLDKSNSSQVVFRTPQLSRKGIPRTPSLKHLKDFDTPSSDHNGKSDKKGSASSLTYEKRPISRSDYQRLENELASLAEKYNKEINFKNLEITHLKDKLEEVKSEENKLNLILEEKKVLEVERSQELLNVKLSLDVLDEKIRFEREEYSRCIEDLNEKIGQLQASKKELEEAVVEKESAIKDLEHMFSDLQSKYNAMLELNDVNSEILNNICEESTKRFDSLMQLLKSKEEQLQQHFDSIAQELHIDTLSKLNLTLKDVQTKSQTMDNETEKCVSMIKQLKFELDKKVKDLSSAIEVADERCRLMFRELCTVEKQRDDLVTSDLEKKLHILEIQQVIEELKSDLEQSRIKCKRYEITQNTMNETIGALSTRLIESEHEVERLNKVEANLESQRQALEEKSKYLLNDIMDLRVGMENLEREIVNDVTQMKTNLEAKVEYFKNEAAKQVEAFKQKLNEKQQAIELLLNENESLRQIIETKEEEERKYIHNIKICQEEIIDLKNVKVQCEKEYECNIKEYHFKLNSLIEENQKEVHTLERENINKAQNIVDLSMTIDSLKETIDEYCGQLCGLREEKHNLVAELTEIKEELNSAKNENFVKTQIIEEISSITENLKEAIKEHTEKINILEEEKGKLASQIIDLNVEIDELRDDNICKDEVIKEMSSNNKMLKESNIECAKDIVSLQKQKDEMNEKLSKLTGVINSLRDESLGKDELIESYSTNCDMLKQTVKDLENNIRHLNAEKNKLTIDLADAKEEIVNLRDNSINNSHTIEEYEKRINSLVSEKNKLFVQLTDIQREISNLKADASSCAHNNAELMKTNKDLQKTLRDYQNNVMHLENEKAALNIQLAKVASENASIIEEQNHLVKQLKDKLNTVEENYKQSLSERDQLNCRLKSQIEKVKTHILNERKLIDATKKIEQFESLMAVKDQELNKLRDRLLEVSVDDVEALRERVEVLQLQLAKVTEERDQADKELADLMGHQNTLQKIKHINQLKQQYSELREEVDRITIENTMLKKKLSESKDKENVLVESTPKPLKQKLRTNSTLSPNATVLRDRNH